MGTNKNKKNSKYQQLGLLIAIIGLMASYYYYISNSQEYKEKVLAQQHKNAVSMKDCAYLEGSTIERELKKIIDSFSDQVKMVVGKIRFIQAAQDMARALL